MILKEKERYLIVTRKEYFPLLFSFKNAHPNLSLKFIEKRDFFSLLSLKEEVAFFQLLIPIVFRQALVYFAYCGVSIYLKTL